MKVLCRKCRETFDLKDLEVEKTGEFAKVMGFKSVYKCKKCSSYAFEIHEGINE